MARKKRRGLTTQEQEIYDVKSIIWRLKRKHFGDFLDVKAEKPKPYVVMQIPSKKEMKQITKEIEQELNLT